MKRLVSVAGLVVISVCLTACGSSFKTNDPAGYAACAEYKKSVVSKESVVRLAGIFDADRNSEKATTPAIREAAKTAIGNQILWDVSKLRTACEDQGFEIPEVKHTSS